MGKKREENAQERDYEWTEIESDKWTEKNKLYKARQGVYHQGWCWNVRNIAFATMQN